ncbi:MAG: class D sortase [Anaerolineae bacterium]|jgi:sortase A|nr:class D sortase [Anaerolineae bacterium]
MRDKRPVDELSIEELERILIIRRREQRQQRLGRMRQEGRLVDSPPTPPVAAQPSAQPAAAPNPPKPVEPVRAARPTPTDGAPAFDDEDELNVARPAPSPQDEAARKTWTNRFLTLIEVAAVVALVVIGFNLFTAVSTLERQTAQVQEEANAARIAGIPTPEPTSILSVRLEDFVLPGGHIINADNTVSYNLDEFIDDVPSHLQNAVRQQVVDQFLLANVIRPPQTDETALYVSIPRLGLEQSIVQGTDDQALKQGVGQVLNGAVPGGQTGNVVLAAHNDVYGELFRDLDQMQVGDEFYIQTRTGTYTYRVTGTDIVEPTDVYVMADQGRPTATLISCYPYRVNDKRYIVFAELISGASA